METPRVPIKFLENLPISTGRNQISQQFRALGNSKRSPIKKAPLDLFIFLLSYLLFSKIAPVQSYRVRYEERPSVGYPIKSIGQREEYPLDRGRDNDDKRHIRTYTHTHSPREGDTRERSFERGRVSDFPFGPTAPGRLIGIISFFFPEVAIPRIIGASLPTTRAPGRGAGSR